MRRLLLIVVSAVCLVCATPAVADQPSYLGLASQGAARSSLWWDGAYGWYLQRLDHRQAYPLATVWSTVPLFESLDALELASPSAARRRAIARFAAGARRYFDPALAPRGGYAPYPGDRSAHDVAFFDDNGWLGMAFADAYAATGDRVYLRDADRAFRFIMAAGWDRSAGGLWWSTAHPYKAGETLASAILLGSDLYRATGGRWYRDRVHWLISWADGNMLIENGLYGRSDLDPTPMPYVQGPIALGFAHLCEAGERGFCARAADLARASEARFPVLQMGPQYDWIYLRCLLELGRIERDPGPYALADGYGREAVARSAVGGLWLKAWDGSSMSAHESSGDMLQTHAATTALFAWLAALRP